MKILKITGLVLVSILLSSTFTNVLAAEVCGYCPPFYCEDVPLARSLKQQKKQAAERLGLPPRLSALFDTLGDCRACVETAPDWPHLIVVYDGEKLSELYQREILSYSRSRPWTAANEYKARQDKIAGLATAFHVTLGSRPCKCCKAKSEEEYETWTESIGLDALEDDPLWNSGLDTYQSHTISYTSGAQARDIPTDLEEIAPINKRTEPVPGRLGDYQSTAPIRVVQVLCQHCQPLADQYNELGSDTNRLSTQEASLHRDTDYEEAMAEYSRESINALNQVANTENVRDQIRSHTRRMDQAFEALEGLRPDLDRVQRTISDNRAQLTNLLRQLQDCEAQQCSADQEPEPIPSEALIISTFGGIDFSHTNKLSDCPQDSGMIAFDSNNGNPLAISDISLNGSLSEHIDQNVIANETDAPIIVSNFNCNSSKPKKLKGKLSAKVTDTVTGEAVVIEVNGKGSINKSGKSTNDPNHSGSIHKKDNTIAVRWEPVVSKCEQCQKLVAQYNDTIKLIFKTRRQIERYENIIRAPAEKGVGIWHAGEGSSTNLDTNSAEGVKSLDHFMGLMDLYNAILKNYRSHLLQLEQQAQYLQKAISDCELQQCGKKSKTKMSPVLVGGLASTEPFQPELSQLFLNYDGTWEGPYSTNCQPCTPITKQLNAMPGWLTRAHFKLVNAQYQLDHLTIGKRIIFPYTGATPFEQAAQEVETAQQEIAALMRLNNKLLQDLIFCEEKFCSSTDDSKNSQTSRLFPGSDLRIGGLSTCPKPAADEAIIIGPNNEVGSSANFKEKAGKKVAGAAAGAVAGLLGLGGGGGNSKGGPPTYKDPVKNKHKLVTKDKKAKRELKTGGLFTKGGLLISNEIKKTPGKGTFHSIYLENAQGWRLMPISLYMYEIWGEWKLNVSWTKDTYVDGEHVAHDEGGWSESWKELIAKGEYVNYVEVQEAPIWEQLGFNTAVSGARSLGTLFPITPRMLTQGPWNLVVHITDPKKDPVITQPYIYALSLADKGIVTLKEVNNTTASNSTACLEKTSPFTIGPPGGQVESPNGVTVNDDNYAFVPADTNDTPLDFELTVDGKTIKVAAPEHTDTSVKTNKPQSVETVDGVIDLSKYGRLLSADEIAALKTKKQPGDKDGDGIADDIDTKPNQPSDSFFIEGGASGRILNPNGHPITIIRTPDNEARITVEGGESDEPAVFEILGIELELDPWTIIDADFG